MSIRLFQYSTDILSSFNIQQLNSIMNIQKLVSECLTRRRAQSSHTPHSSHNKSYTKNLPTKSSFSISKHKKIGSQESQYFSASAFNSYKPFQPSINELPSNLYKATHKTECSKEQIVQRLLADRRQKQSKWAQVKSCKDEQLFTKQCTFQPQISRNSKRLVMKTQCTEAEDVCQRLYNQGVQKAKLSQTLMNLSQTCIYNDKQNYPFQPNTNYRNVLNDETHNLKPIYMRLQEIMKQKRQHVRELNQKNEKQNLTKKPMLSAKSERILSNKQLFKKNILDRISVYIEDQKKNTQQMKQRKLQLELQGCTFQPEINQTPLFSQNFHRRQEQYMRRLQSKLSSRILKQTSQNFKPKINKISQILTNERDNETWQEKIHRHAYQNTDREYIMAQLEQEAYKQCTFEPQINSVSKCLNAQHIYHKCDNQPKCQEYEFKPKINKISQYLVKMRRDQGVDTERQRQENKKNNVNQIKMQQQYKQMKQCTFRPKINKSTKSLKTNRSIQNIAGYEQYCKKIDKIKNMKDQEKIRQQKLFQLQKRYKERKSTEPKAFKLSQGFNHREAIKDQLRKKFQKQCTFTPKIHQHMR